MKIGIRAGHYPQVSLYECRCTQCNNPLSDVLRARKERLTGERRIYKCKPQTWWKRFFKERGPSWLNKPKRMVERSSKRLVITHWKRMHKSKQFRFTKL